MARDHDGRAVVVHSIHGSSEVRADTGVTEALHEFIVQESVHAQSRTHDQPCGVHRVGRVTPLNENRFMPTARLVLLTALLLAGSTPSHRASALQAERLQPTAPAAQNSIAFDALRDETWWKGNYDAYLPDAAAIESLRKPLQDVSIEVFFGRWCGDSRRQLPRLAKVLERTGFDFTRALLTPLSDQVGEYKKLRGGGEPSRRVVRTPTIVVVRDGREIGRIVETPQSTLEQELREVIEGRAPPTRYGAETWIHELASTLSVADFEKRLLTADAEISKRGDPDSLTHYAEHDLIKNRKWREVVAVTALHLRLRPRSALAFVLQAEALIELGRTVEAREAIDQALAIEPQNGRAKALLGRLSLI